MAKRLYLTHNARCEDETIAISRVYLASITVALQYTTNQHQKEKSKDALLVFQNNSPHINRMTRQPSQIEPANPLHTTKILSRLEQARAAALNSLHLSLGESRPPEPLGQLVAIPHLALLWLHAAQHSCGTASNRAVGRRGRLRCC